ncbi:MAG: cytochrome c3 family protein [Endomicrobiales bacterium]|jgi:hypothetical protein
MSQLFKARDTHIFRLIIFAGIILLAGSVVVMDLFQRFSFVTGVNRFTVQDVPFSHEHHVKEIGIDCKFCHTSVTQSSFAGIPPTQTCMKCHRVLFKDAPMLAPVRRSFETGKPLVWARVYSLPDFVYFDHSIHIANGVSCVTCHGELGDMPFVRKNKAFFMRECLECHRNPGQYLSAAELTGGSGKNIKVTRFNEKVIEITNCSTCHR